MAYSYISSVGNGSNRIFNAPEYIDKTHIEVHVDGTQDTTFTWVTDSTIQTTTAPVNGAVVLVKRVTPVSQRLVDFTNASILVESELDKSALQLLYIVQESFDRTTGAFLLDTLTNTWDADGKKISDLAAGTLTTDAVNKGQLDTVATTANADAATATAAANSATTQASNALNSANNAAVSASNAALSASAAQTAADNATALVAGDILPLLCGENTFNQSLYGGM